MFRSTKEARRRQERLEKAEEELYGALKSRIRVERFANSASHPDAITDQQEADIVSMTMEILQNYGMTSEQAVDILLEMHGRGLVIGIRA